MKIEDAVKQYGQQKVERLLDGLPVFANVTLRPHWQAFLDECSIADGKGTLIVTATGGREQDGVDPRPTVKTVYFSGEPGSITLA